MQICYKTLKRVLRCGGVLHGVIFLCRLVYSCLAALLSVSKTANLLLWRFCGWAEIPAEVGWVPPRTAIKRVHAPARAVQAARAVETRAE